MKKNILVTIILVMILALCLPVSAVEFQPSRYEILYSKFVDTNRPLAELQQADLVDGWKAADEKHPLLKDIQDSNRVDYFDVAYGSDPLQNLDIHHLKGDKLRPVIIYIHGGGYVGGDKSHSRYEGPTFLSLGYTVVSINYRLAPKDPYPAQIEDCAMALKWVIDNISKYGGDPNNIAITGQSAGGHLTALLVTGTKWHQKYNIDISKVKCWIPESGITDFNLPENYYHALMPSFLYPFLGNPDSKYFEYNKNDASSVTHITGNEPPCLILHGADDYLVPRSNSIELYNKLVEKGVNVKLEVLKSYTHVDVIVNYGDQNDRPTKIVNKFLAEYLPTDTNK